MIYLRFFIFMLSFIAMPRLFAAETLFFEIIHDVPLMPALVERVDEAVLFDKPGGRVVESVAEMGVVSRAEVLGYYATSLPQFGWISQEDHVFLRGAERLELVFETHDGLNILRVLIRPR